MTYVYDKVGRQTVRVDQKNRRTTYVYDDLDYTHEPDPPLSSAYAAWADELLRKCRIR
jgi:hypothetical protein